MLRDAEDAAALAEKGWRKAQTARHEAQTARRASTAQEKRAKATLATVRREFALFKKKARSAARSAPTAGSVIPVDDSNSSSEMIALKEEVVVLTRQANDIMSVLGKCREALVDKDAALSRLRVEVRLVYSRLCVVLLL